MKKGYYIYFKNTTSMGVAKKIKMQIDELSKEVHVEQITVLKRTRGFLSRVYGLLPCVSNKYDYDELFSKIKNPDFVYIRAILTDYKYIKFLQRIKINYPSCKIIIEYPTYPYDKEHKQLEEKFFLFKDKYHRRFLFKYVDRFVIYTKQKKILGVPTLRTKNGICVNEIKIAKRKRENNAINLLAVGHFQKAHGYERCIKGLSQYYREGNKREIHINIVGDGDELKNYKKIASDYGMNQYITFYGRKEGEELDELYNETDIALGVFGLYKVGLEVSSALKIREYLAKGLPIISGCTEDVFEEQKSDFYYGFPNDSSNIDMNIVVDFYDRIYGNGKEYEQVHEEIRRYAYQTIDMQITIKNIIEYIKY